jgi:PBP1b-binding outer membrane lipoprotein LpoB
VRIDRRHLAALLGAAALMAGCGSDEEEPEPSIPAASAEAIEVRLDEVQRRYQEGTENDNPGACEDIADDSFPAIQDQIDNLPSSVDKEVRDTLVAGLAHLVDLVESGCADVEQTDTETTEETTPTETVTTPPETETTPPETETTPPETTPQQPTTPQQDPGGGGGGTQVPEGED